VTDGWGMDAKGELAMRGLAELGYLRAPEPSAWSLAELGAMREKYAARLRTACEALGDDDAADQAWLDAVWAIEVPSDSATLHALLDACTLDAVVCGYYDGDEEAGTDLAVVQSIVRWTLASQLVNEPEGGAS
jgi:hypothetical protein